MAYPVVTMMMYGVARVGRKERWEALEWLRMGALATLFGMIIAVQVKLISIGATSHPIAIAAAITSLIGIAALIGVYLWERFREWKKPLPKLSAVVQA